MTKEQAIASQIESLKRRIQEAVENRKSTGELTGRLCALRTRQLRDENRKAKRAVA